MRSDSRWVFLMLKIAPCSCRCRHCCFAVSPRIPPARLEQTIACIEPFVQARARADAGFDELAVLLGDSPLNFPGLPACARYLRENHVEGWRSFPSNGFALRDPQDWHPLLADLCAAGTEFLEFTLYGEGETHDRFARRPHDFDAVLSLARLWVRLGGKTLWGVVAHKGNVSELASLRARIRDSFGADCPAWIWSYQGRGVGLEDLRLDAADRAALDPDLQAELSIVRPEREWVARMTGVLEHPFERAPRVRLIAVESDGSACIPYTPPPSGRRGVPLADFPVASVGHFLEEWTERYDEWRAGYPSLAHLGATFGDATGDLLYDEASVKAKWCHLYDAAARVMIARR